MARFLIFVPCFILSACALSPTDKAIISTKESVVTLKKSLTAECKTDAIISQIDSINTQIESISSVCNTEISQIKAEKHTWQVACIGLVLLIILYFWKKK